jgi:hypothetical protein
MMLGVFLERYRNIKTENKWLKNHFGNENVFLYVVDFSYGGNGNVMGMYFAALSCAKLIGAHFVAVRRPGVPLPDKYLASFPLEFRHPNPLSRNESVSKIQTMGNCDSTFPWQSSDSGIYSNLDEIKQLIKNSINTFKDSEYGPGANRDTMMTNFSTFDISNYFFNENNNHVAFMPASKISNAVEKVKTKPAFGRPQRKDDIIRYVLENRNESRKEEVFLQHFTKKTPKDVQMPVIPDAAISIRCIDVLLGHTEQYSPYGFLNFNVYKQIIPIDASTIYIFTEPHFHGKTEVMEEVCLDIMTTLVVFLDHYYPNALVALKRAHQAEAIIALSHAPIVICPPSTFCIWPAMANVNNVHFAISGLLMSHRPLFVADNWDWIAYPHVHQFGHLSLQGLKRSTNFYTKQVSAILNVLISDGPYVSSLEDREKLSIVASERKLYDKRRLRGTNSTIN